MSVYTKIGASVLTLMCNSAFAQLDVGYIPPSPGENGYNSIFEAVGGWGLSKNLSATIGLPGQEHNTICGGVLIAPNILAVPLHCFGGTDILDFTTSVLSAVNTSGEIINTDLMWYQYNQNDAVHTPMYTVRFRLNPEGDVGNLDDGYESYYQTPVKRIILPARDSTGEHILFEDIILLVLADNNNDTQNNGMWANGWIDHITPVPFLPTLQNSSQEFSGTLASYGPRAGVGIPGAGDSGVKGTLRLYNFNTNYFHSPDISRQFVSRGARTSIPEFTDGNSGGALFYQTESGQYICGFGLSGGLAKASVFPGSPSWNEFFRGPGSLFGEPMLYPTSNFDVTGSASINSLPNTPAYNIANWSINLNDVIAMAALSPTSMLTKADWNEDQIVNIDDYNEYIDDLSTTLNPYSIHGIFPLAIGDGDVNNDSRFTIQDKISLEAKILSADPADLVFDFNQNNMIDQGDVLILDRALSTIVPGHGPIDNGMLGDADKDGDIDLADYNQILSTNFDNTIEMNDPSYRTTLDWNMNRILDFGDLVHIASVILPGDVATINNTTPPTGSTRWVLATKLYPDFYLDPSDFVQYFHRVSTDSSFGTGKLPVTSITGFDYVGIEWRGFGDPVQPDGLLTAHDIWFVLNQISTAFDPTLSSGMNSLLDFWFLDLNNDGRFNQLDVRELESIFNDPQSMFMEEWDFNNNLSNGTNDLDFLLQIAHKDSPVGQGILGDFNKDASPTCVCQSRPNGIVFSMCEDNQTSLQCTDNDPIPTYTADCQDLFDMMCVDYDNDPTTTWIDDIFNSGTIFVDDDYIAQLDGDLDGDIDSDDQALVLQTIQLADLAPNGVLNFFDTSEFLSRFAAQDPSVDFNLDGQFNFFDVSIFTTAYSSPCGACPLPCCQ